MDWIPKIIQLPITDNEGAVVGFRDVLLDYYARFSDEERAQIIRVLRQYPANRVDEFLALAQTACDRYRTFLKQRKAPEIRSDIKDTLPTLKKALREIKKLQTAKPYVVQMEKIPDATEQGQVGYSRHIAAMSGLNVKFFADESARCLGALVELLEDLQPPTSGKGRPTSEGGFAQSLADIYYKCFQEHPSSWREGDLAEILKICLGGLGLKNDDPERRLKSIRQK